MQERFNQYYLTKQITSKSSGSVYLAYPNNLTSQKVILKVFNAASFTSNQQSQDFLQQIKKISELKHPSIVPMLDFGIEQGQLYVAREYVAGDSLRQQMDHMSPRGMDLQDALKIISQVGQALCYAHQHQIFHGNLKPENIFLTSNDEVLISDFGITSFINIMKLQDQSDYWQTTDYLAPEQLVGTITHKSDQYALGCLTYELLTGHAPSSAQSFSPIVSLPLDEGELTNAIEEETETACRNSQCPDYGKTRGDNVRKFGKTRKGMQRWQCKTCRITWSFPSIETKSQTRILPFSNLSHNIPDTIENVVFKAMARNPAERYADIFIFLNTLQIVSSLPACSLTSSPVSTYIPRQVENTPSEVPVIRTIREHRKQIPNNYSASKPLKTLNSETYLPDKASVTPHPDAHLPNKSIVSSKPETRLPNQVGMMSDSDPHLPSKTIIPFPGSRRPSKDHIEVFPEGRHAQFNKPLAPTLWLAFALSGFVLLLGTLVFNSIAPLATPASPKPMKQIVRAQTSAKITPTPTPTPTPKIQFSRKVTFSPPEYPSMWAFPNAPTLPPPRQVTPTSTVQPSMPGCNPYTSQPYNCPYR